MQIPPSLPFSKWGTKSGGAALVVFPLCKRGTEGDLMERYNPKLKEPLINSPQVI